MRHLFGAILITVLVAPVAHSGTPLTPERLNQLIQELHDLGLPNRFDETLRQPYLAGSLSRFGLPSETTGDKTYIGEQSKSMVDEFAAKLSTGDAKLLFLGGQDLTLPSSHELFIGQVEISGLVTALMCLKLEEQEPPTPPESPNPLPGPSPNRGKSGGSLRNNNSWFDFHSQIINKQIQEFVKRQSLTLDFHISTFFSEVHVGGKSKSREEKQSPRFRQNGYWLCQIETDFL